jgi:predicted SAM-dependent methyltransferase
VFDGIFTEHTLEHLNYKEVARILSECQRTLKPGGIIRIIVPDMSVFVANYASDNRSWFQNWERAVLRPRGRSMISPMEALSFETQEHGHRSAWDFETMTVFLTRAGFIEICRCTFGNGTDARLLQDKDAVDRTMISLYVEARKSTVAAGTAPMLGN